MKHVTIQFRKYHVTSPWISRQRSFLVPCRYRDSEIMEPKNCLPRTSSALPIKLHFQKDFPCPNSQEIEQFIWLQLQWNILLHHPAAMLYRSQTASYRMCNAVWDGFKRFIFDTKSFRHKWKSFDTHLKSIWHKLKSIWYKLRLFRSKSELHVEEISHESLSMFASHMTDIDQKNVVPEGEKSRLSGGLATFSGVSLSSCAGSQWGFSAGHF